MKTILITGASSGLGASLALSLASRGHRVWATMRNLAKQEALVEAAKQRNLDLVIRQLDVEKMESVAPCVAEMMATEGRIDVLVNNAGAGFVRTTEQASEEEIRWVMDINFMGVVRCTKAVMPHMRVARSGHIVNISSIGGLVGQPFNEIYCAAKFAVEGYTEAMASYIETGFGIKFSVVEPGGIQSEFAKTVMSQLNSTGGILQDDYLPLFQQYINRVQSRSPEELARVYQSPEQVAEVVSECIEADNPPVRLRTSPWAEEFCRFKTASDSSGKLQQAAVIARLL